MKKKFGLLLATLLVASTAAFTACNLAGGNSSSEETSSQTTSSSSVAPATYTVTFDANGGSAVASATVTENEKVTKPTDPTKTGYTFGGWYLGEAAFDFESVAITTDVTLTAKWNVVTYTATVGKAGETGTQVQFTIENRTAKLAEIAAMLPTDTAEFDYEWAEALPTELALNDTQAFTYTSTTRTYTVSFDENGGSTVEDVTVDYGTTLSGYNTSKVPTKEGYTFVGWTKEDDSALPETVTGAITLKASWDIVTYTATIVNGSERTPVQFTVLNRADVLTEIAAMLPTDPTNRYVYSWETELPNELVLNNEQEFTVIVNENPLVSFDVDGGTAIDSVYVTEGVSLATVIADMEAVKTGATFLYWTYANGNEITDTDVVNEDVTVKAVWGIGEAVTLQIADKEGFLAMGQGYHEKEWKYITYELTTDLSFVFNDYTLTEESFGPSKKANAYLVDQFAATLDGKGHKVQVTFGTWDDPKNYGYPTIFKKITGTIKNVYFKVLCVVEAEMAAVALENYGSIENCYFTADIANRFGDMYANFYANRSAMIVMNYGVVDKCVFSSYCVEAGKVVYTNYAVRMNAEGATFSNCSMIGKTEQKFISTDYNEWHEIHGSLTDGNADAKRSNSYVFASAADLVSGNGGKYNADGTITAGTYTDVKDLYTGTYWSAWLV